MAKKIKWVGTLSTTRRNNVDLIQVRQNNVNSEVLGFNIVDDNGELYDLKNRKVLFCTYFDKFAPVEQYAEVIENGKIVYTMNQHDMQKPVRINFAYFKILDEKDNLVDTTQSFSYDIMPSIESKCMDSKPYIIRLEELLDAFLQINTDAKKELEQIIIDFNQQVIEQQQNFDIWFESIREILESVDPNGVILTELVDFRYSKMLDKHFNRMKDRGDFWDEALKARVYDIKWFGAVGNGIHNDTEAFKKAVDENINSEGVSVLITDGTYMVDEEIFIKFAKTRISSTFNAKIKMLNNKTLFTTSKDYCGFFNIEAEGNGEKADNPYSGCGIKILGSKKVDVVECKFTDFSGHNIFLSYSNEKGCRSCNILRNECIVTKDIERFDDCSAIMIGYSGDKYFHKANIIEYNVIHGGNQNFKIGIGLIGHGMLNKIRNNQVEACEEYGILLYESSYVDFTLHSNEVCSNSVQKIGAKEGRTTHKGMGIYLQKSHRTIVKNNHCVDTLINSDSSETLSRGAIAIAGSNGCSFSENLIHNSGKHGLVVASSYGLKVERLQLFGVNGQGIRILDSSKIKFEDVYGRGIKFHGIYGVFDERASGLEETLGSSGYGVSFKDCDIENESNHNIYLVAKSSKGILYDLHIEDHKGFSNTSFVYIDNVRNGRIINSKFRSSTAQGSIIVTNADSDGFEFDGNLLETAEKSTIGFSYSGKNLDLGVNKVTNSAIPYYYKENHFSNPKEVLYHSNPPTKGSWAIGDRVINTSPTVGNYTEWVYTSTGWKGLNKLD